MDRVKARIDLKTETGTTALYLAAFKGQVHSIELLIGNRSNVDCAKMMVGLL